MSVKFQDKFQDQVTQQVTEQIKGQIQGQFQEEAAKSIRQDTKELVHKVGERLTGGNPQNGYMAVCLSSTLERWLGDGYYRGRYDRNSLTWGMLTFTDVPASAAEEPSAHEDVDVGCAFRISRILGLVDRE